MSSPEAPRLCDLLLKDALSLQPGYVRGRQLRVFVRLAASTFVPVSQKRPELTVGRFCDELRAEDPARWAPLPIGTKAPGQDASLHTALQDLADDLIADIHDAADAAFSGGVYAGADVEPVPAGHVRRVMAAMQRELDRELRSGPRGGPRLPALQLAELPWDIQCALAERRRYRYAQWGITSQRWRTGTWSLWAVPRDDDYLPIAQQDGQTSADMDWTVFY